MKAMRTVKDVMDKVRDIRETGSMLLHINATKGNDLNDLEKNALIHADELLEEFENLLAGMQLGGGDYQGGGYE